ncbi:WW domain binding protein 11-domain-containing protein [Pleurostoma richardsiae]|uniref:WW domain binding protein 11-domain-containing protein n=1 Tax=Pleurostoma richardsiae TaxID=41990 RepID=A0AA38S2W3_9PEZI|nr:WW domain binding protein 11-domain-containing protein [Pleurostoma richardsiae]
MPKEKNFNPVQAARKAEKAKTIKKGKAEVAARRNERLAKRNPERIKKQIDDLKAITDGGGKLTRHEEETLQGLEKELKAIVKAREALGDKAPTFGRGPPREGGHDRGVLGKRRRDADDASSSDSDIPEDVKSIPMPRDTPPPIPKEILDKWYSKRREKREEKREEKRNANLEPLGDRRGFEQKPTPPAEPKTVYEAAPVVRDLRKEAVTAFTPTVVKMKIQKTKGEGGLMEPEEADQLERAGYLKSREEPSQSPPADTAGASSGGPHKVTLEEVEEDDG